MSERACAEVVLRAWLLCWLLFVPDSSPRVL